MLTFIEVKDLPDDAITSDYLKGRAKVYAKILYTGHSYYIPITNKVKKAFHIKQSRGKTKIDYDSGVLLENFVRDIIAAVHLQVRDTVGDSIYRQLSGEIKTGMEKLYSDKLLGAIGNGFEQRQIGSPDAEKE